MRDRPIDRDQFRRLRRNAGLTQAQLAERAGVSLSYIKYIEGGPTEPSRPYAAVLADALGCTVDDFTIPGTSAA